MCLHAEGYAPVVLHIVSHPLGKTKCIEAAETTA